MGRVRNGPAFFYFKIKSSVNLARNSLSVLLGLTPDIAGHGPNVVLAYRSKSKRPRHTARPESKGKDEIPKQVRDDKEEKTKSACHLLPHFHLRSP